MFGSRAIFAMMSAKISAPRSDNSRRRSGAEMDAASDGFCSNKLVASASGAICPAPNASLVAKLRERLRRMLDAEITGGVTGVFIGVIIDMRRR